MQKTLLLLSFLSSFTFCFAQNINPYNPYYPPTIEGYIQALIEMPQMHDQTIYILKKKWGFKMLRETLLKGCKKKEGKAKGFYLRLLGGLDDRSLVPFIADFLNDPTPVVSITAASALGQQGYPEAAPYLGEYLLTHKADHNTYHLIKGLERISTKEAFQYLERIKPLYSESKNLVGFIEEAMRLLKKYSESRKKKKELKRLLSQPESHVQFYWATLKVYQQSTPKISLSFIKNLFKNIENKNEILKSLMHPNYDKVISDEEAYYQYGRYLALLKLRKYLGDQLTMDENNLLAQLRQRF